MGEFELSPVLVYALGVVGATYLLRQLAAAWIGRRGWGWQRALRPVGAGCGVVAAALLVLNLVLGEPWSAYLFSLFALFAQAGALLLTLRLAEHARALERMARLDSEGDAA